MISISSLDSRLFITLFAEPTPGRITNEALEISDLFLVIIAFWSLSSIALCTDRRLAPPQSTIATVTINL